MTLDTSFYYQLTNQFHGADQALDVKPDGSGRLMMAEREAVVTGQFWRLVDRGEEKYSLRTEYLGDCFSLDVINNAQKDTPWLASTEDTRGQFWTLTPWGDGTYKLTNDFTGPQQSLDTAAGTNEPRLAPGDHTGQHWKLIRAKKIESYIDVPDLEPYGTAQPNEGPTDSDLYAKSEGVLKAVMIFVEFPDAPASASDTSPEDVARHLLGDGKAQRLFADQSYQRLTLDVTVASHLGWRMMGEDSTKYRTHDTADLHKEYIVEAAELFSGDVKFSDFDLVLIATLEGADLGGASAFKAFKGTGAVTASGEIRLAVTFDGSSLGERYTTLVHEVGHLLGLPDLYPFGRSAECSSAGCWSIMSDIYHATGFLGWHRHKNGWLGPLRKTYIADPKVDRSVTLHPLSGSSGLSMLVFPVDNPVKPSKVFVVELAQRVRSMKGAYRGEGVLLYTVDATVLSGFSPVVIIPKKVSRNDEFGFLFEASYVDDDSKEHRERTASLALKVNQRFGASYNVKISYERQ